MFDALKIKVSIFINYFLFAILLNSVGTVILEAQRYFNISESAASMIEVCKDISIALTSFLVASFVVRIGYKRSMLLALGLISLACFIIPSVKTLLAIKILFAVTGLCFALTKVSVFGTIGLISGNRRAHISTMNFIESFFMIGVLAGYFIFSYYVNDGNIFSPRWFNVYYLLGGLSLAAFLLLLSSNLDETLAKMNRVETKRNGLPEMLKLILLPVTISFVVCAFLYVLIEQGMMSWLPSFNNKVLQFSSVISIQVTSIFVAATALGRFIAGIILKKINWFIVLIFCLTATAILVLISLQMTNDSSAKEVSNWFGIPLTAYIFSLIGFFLAPVYPAINSVILASLPVSKHGMMSGLIVVFSALGGVTGSVISGFIFQYYGGRTAFYFSLLPIAILIFALFVFEKKKNPGAESLTFEGKRMQWASGG